MKFKPTHRIVLNGEVIYVMDDEGVLYTRIEWDACAKADWTRDDDGRVVFQGQAPIGEYSVTKLTRR